MTSRFTSSAQNALNKSLYIARELGHTYVGTEHLLLGLIYERDSVAATVLEGQGMTAFSLREALEITSGTGSKSSVSSLDMTPRLKRVIEQSASASEKYGQQYIGTEHLLLSLMEEKDSSAVRLVKLQGAFPSSVCAEIISVLGGGASLLSALENNSDAFEGKRSYLSPIASFPNLSRFGKDITLSASKGKLDPIVGRKREIDRAIGILCRRTKNNPCLIGEPGVGKTAIVEGLSLLIANGEVPSCLQGKSIVSLDMAAMIAGAKYRGEFEERMKGIINELSRLPDVILFIDEMHTLIGAGSAEGALDAANIIKPALARGEIQVIGATTASEYRKRIEKDPALERRLQPVNVEEPTPAETVEILKGIRDRYEAFHRVRITDGAIRAAVDLSVRYICDRFLPDKAIDLIDEAASKAKIKKTGMSKELSRLKDSYYLALSEKEEAIIRQDFEKAAEMKEKEERAKILYESEKQSSKEKSAILSVKEEDIADVVTAMTGIEANVITKSEAGRLFTLSDELKKRVIGQNEAAELVARAIRRGRTGIGDKNRPIGSFVFSGSTGVGKTELCLSLAEVLFGDRRAVIKLDMSEYSEKNSVSKLIGSPPGYVGYEDGGGFVTLIRRRPYSVVVFDEIEKAHPDVWNLLLQVLEDGRLTDSQGRRADFRNAVIIMTTNAGSKELLSKNGPLGFGGALPDSDSDEKKKRVFSGLKDIFPPEFLGRIDEIVVFRTLGEEEAKKITCLLLDKTKKRIKEAGYDIEFSDEAISYIAKAASDPSSGARPIRRKIQSEIEDRISDRIIDRSLRKGDKIKVDCENGEIVLR